MIPYFQRAAITVSLLAAVTASLPSCSTGIESTKKIRMTKDDIRMMVKTPEQMFAETIEGTPLSNWKKGKEFLAMSDRTLYIFEPTGLDEESSAKSVKGEILTFEGLDSQANPDLMEECILLFSDGTTTLRYQTGKSTEAAMNEIVSSKIPLMSDLDIIRQWKDKTLGSTLWTKSNLWYDARGERIPGLKFAKVKIVDVEPSTGDFPINIKINDETGREAYIQMNYTSDLRDSRNFAALFSISDPRKKYPKISDEHWALIQQGKIGEGMTKEECKLSIGNPDEVRAGHNRSQTMDIWQYSDGTYLMFTDGLVTNYRQ